MTPSDDDLTFADEVLDPFAPARVDDTIAEALLDRNAARGSPEGRVVLALAAGHGLPAGAETVIERVRVGLAAAPLTQPAPAGADGALVAPRPAHRPAVPRPVSRAQNTLRALAAVLVVTLLAGGFVAVLHGRQGSVTHAPRWVDVSITHAHTTQPLDFDLANGISYAVAQTGGMIYACSGRSLWYSDDSGVSYAPFTPAPPAGTLDGMCTLGTVAGLPGVFVDSELPGEQTISYGEPGGSWRTLTDAGVVPSVASGVSGASASLPLPQGRTSQGVGASIFSPQLTGGHVAQYAGQWLFLVVQQGIQDRAPGDPNWALIATRDFGKTWVWLDATLYYQGHLNCANFVIPPSNSSALECATENPDARTSTPGLAFSDDFGQTWQTAAGAEPEVIAGASAGSIYFVQPGKGEANFITRYDLAPRSLVALATLPDWPRSPLGPAPPLALMPDNTVYQPFARGGTGRVTVGLDALAPFAAHVTQAVPPATLRAKGLTATLAFGDLDGTSPALYLGVGNSVNKGDISPLYRLALPAPTSTPPQWTAVLETPTVPSPPPPGLPSACAGDPETTAAIRPGGLGALSSTFAPRWGGSDGVAAGTTYFGRYQDTGMPIVGVPSTALGPGTRVPNLTYHVDSTAHVTLAQAQAIAATILPADVHAVPNDFGTPPATAKPIPATYCSAAFWAAFPPGTPSFTHGELAATYNLRPDGTVDSIDFGGALIT